MTSDGIGSGESFDERPDVPASESPEPAAPPEYADPVEELDDAQEAETIRTDGNFDDFEPDEVASTDEQDTIAWHEPDTRQRPDDAEQEVDEDAETYLDDAEAVATQSRQDTARRAQPEAETDDDTDERETATEDEQLQDKTPPAASDADKDQESKDKQTGDYEETAGDRDDKDDRGTDDPHAAEAENDGAADQVDEGTIAEPEAADTDANEQGTEHRDHGDVFDDVRRAHAETMEAVRQANEDVKQMIADANREILEMIRTGEIHNLPDQPDEVEVPNMDIEDVDLPDVDWERRSTDTADTTQTPDTWPYLEGRRPAPEGWQEWEEADDRQPPDDQPSPDNDWSQPDDDEVDWGKQVDLPDEFEDIPYLTKEAVDARTQASLEHNRELVTQPEPILARDYSQEIKPIDEMEPGGVIHMGPTQIHILKGGDMETFATEWHAHVERQEAARYSHGYAKDARPLSSQGMHDLARNTLAGEHDGRHYFQEAIPAVMNGRCDPDQLRTVLNELHPELRDKYGFYQPAGWRNLPYVKDSAAQPKPTRQYLQAEQAIEGYVRSLPDGDRYGKGDSPNNSAAIRLRAEVDLYLRTRDAAAPRAIREVRLHRLASALETPKVWYDKIQKPRAAVLRQLPTELRVLYHNARAADPMARIFRIYR